MCRKYSFPMSVKKSWDVERSSARPAAKEPLQTKPARKVPPQPRRSAPGVVATRPHSRATVSKEPLKIRRAKARRMFYVGLGFFAVVLVGALLYGAWLPSLRVDTVTAEGPHTDDIVRMAQEELVGTHLFIVPKNSLFFIPEARIRKRILSQQPSIVAVSIKSSGLNSIRVIALERSSAFLWCGVSHAVPATTCYHADPDGLIFAPDVGPLPAATSTALLRVYVPLADNAVEPVTAHTGYASVLPNSLRLAKAFRALGANISELALRSDEADFYTASGTRITYVIGKEKEAAQLAASVFSKLMLNDGSIEYVDLRFERVYLRRQGVSPEGVPVAL